MSTGMGTLPFTRAGPQSVPAHMSGRWAGVLSDVVETDPLGTALTDLSSIPFTAAHIMLHLCGLWRAPGFQDHCEAEVGNGIWVIIVLSAFPAHRSPSSSFKYTPGTLTAKHKWTVYCVYLWQFSGWLGLTSELGLRGEYRYAGCQCPMADVIEKSLLSPSFMEPEACRALHIVSFSTCLNPSLPLALL